MDIVMKLVLGGIGLMVVGFYLAMIRDMRFTGLLCGVVGAVLIGGGALIAAVYSMLTRMIV